MSQYFMLSASSQLTLILLLFLIFLLNLLLLVYKGSHLPSVRRLVPDTIAVLALMTLLYLLVEVKQPVRWLYHIPVWGFILLFLFLLFHAVFGFIREWKRAKNELSPLSIQQAIDDLPLGLCFFDPSGTILLCNRTMSDLGMTLLGSQPQTSAELERALLNLPDTGSVRCLNRSESIFCFPDERVWIFRNQCLTQQGLKGCSQMSAQNITDLYHENLELEITNQHLREVLEKLQKMYERIAETIREKESLELKVYIHDILGRSLLTIRDILEHSPEQMEKKLDLLKEAVRYLSSNSPTSRNTLEKVQKNASELGVTVLLDGYVPPDNGLEQMIAAAVRECVTNCVRHARGNKVHAVIHELSGILKVTITNNGEPPKEKIVEGSGLSTLRRSVEASGGEMFLSHDPVFTMTLYFPGKENDEP